MRCAQCGEPATARHSFCPHCGTRLHHALEEAAAAAPSSQLERRQLTIMFCDLVDSTSLAEGMDPEAFGELIQAHRAACAGPIARYEGTVARYLGDGILVFFGYPVAHEDDPHRAARAGLEIVAATKDLNDRWRAVTWGRLAVRVGINTGIVVVGDLRGDGMREDMAVFGQAVNIAARLQKLADPDTVVLSDETRRLLGGTIHCRSKGEARIKGIENPIDYYDVTAVDDAHRWHRHGADAVAAPPFVDREAELATLARCWDAARSGHGNALLLLGEPGIGKSRFIDASKAQVVRDPCLWLETSTSPYATNTEFYALAGLFRHALQPAEHPPEQAGDQGLQQAVDAYQRADPDMALGFAALLGLEPPGGDITAGSSPERLRRLALAAVGRWLIARAAEQPVVLVIENLHWADASTLEAIDLLLADLNAHRILMIMSSRSEPPLAGLARVETLDLAPLRPDDAQILLRHALKEQAVPRSVADTLLARAGGVPLFIEELPKALISDRRTDDRATALRPPTMNGGATIPATLRDSLMARLDRMGGTKIVAQIGAVLGHRFNAGLMEQVWEGRRETLHAGIEALVGASILLPRQDPQGEQFEFKHPLIEAIAYDSLVLNDRRRYHARAAEILSAQASDFAQVRPEVVARHWAAAGQHLRAFDAWLEAGRAATRRSANVEALGHLQSAEAELTQLEQNEDGRHDHRWSALHMARAPVLTALSGWAAPEVEQAYRSALAIRERVGAQGDDLFYVWRGLGNVYLLRGDLRRAQGVAKHLHRIAVQSDERKHALGSHRTLGLCDFLAGNFRQAVKRLEKAIALYDPEQDRRLAFVEGTDPAVIAYSLKAWAHWFVGQWQTAAENSTAAMDAARGAEHPFSMAYALCLASSLQQCQGRPAQAAASCDEALELSREHAFAYWRGWASIVKGWALVEMQDRDGGLALLEEGLERYAATGAAQMRSYGLCLLAEARQRAGLWEGVAEAAGSAIAEAERTGITFYIVEAYRLRGEALLRLRPGSNVGLRMLTRAVRIADQQRCWALVLRASRSLLAQGGRRQLRTVMLDRATTALKRMRPSCDPSEVQVLEERLAEAAAGTRRARSD